MDDHSLLAPHDIRFEVMRMRWLNLAFVHWPVAPEAVQKLLPDDLVVDTFDGTAWVGLIPFQMEVQLPGGVPIPREGKFPETNVRTYVRSLDGTPGVWFHSLEAGRLPATAVARATYGLPYFWSSMSVACESDRWTYAAERRWPGPKGTTSKMVVEAGEPIDEHSAFDRFLTARWGLYSTFLGRTLYAPVTHPTWPLRRAKLAHLDDELVRAAGYDLAGADPVVHWTPGVTVSIGRPRLVRR